MACAGLILLIASTNVVNLLAQELRWLGRTLFLM
jgi:hypothetical protein